MILRCFPRLARRHRSCGRLGGQFLILSTSLLLVYSLLQRLVSRSIQQPTQSQSFRPLSPLILQQGCFWRDLYTLILDNDPKCQHPPEFTVSQKLDVGFDRYHHHPRPDILWMWPDDLRRLRASHAAFLSDVRKNEPALIHRAGSKGIVMTASLEQLPVLVINLRMLRRTGCELPVEVLFSSLDDYNEQLCNVVFPTLHAICIVFSDIVAASRTGVALEGFQFKIMSILFSSFEDVLLLDSDTFPTRDPAPLFDNEPFKTTGMVLWPDFWYPSESPYFFEITKLGLPPPLNARPAVESGEMMFSKSKHSLTLLLAAYYNYYGLQYFYALLAQGAPGQGDKATFPWAATVIHSNTSFYLVHEPVLALGHVDSSGIFFGSAMAQHNPMEDVQHTSSHLNSDPQSHHSGLGIAEHSKANAPPHPNTSIPSTNSLQPSPFFVHANFPKFDPATIFSYGDPNTARPVIDSNGTAVRAWLPEERSIAYFGYDLERAFWVEVQYVACKLGSVFTAWKETEGICENVKRYGQQVFG